MESQVLYETSYTFHISLLIILVLLVAVPYVMIQQAKAVRKDKSPSNIFGLVMFSIGTLVIIFVTAVVIPDEINMYDSTVGAYNRGDYQIVEGYVENFHPMPKEGHDTESFTVNGVLFEYGYTATFGYHKAKVDGGVITGNGQHLRIGYTKYDWLGKVIVYIEELP